MSINKITLKLKTKLKLKIKLKTTLKLTPTVVPAASKLAVRIKLKPPELLKPIEGCNKYEVSNYGWVRNIESNKILKGGMKDSVYKVNVTNNDGKRKYLNVGILVATNFVANP